MRKLAVLLALLLCAVLLSGCVGATSHHEHGHWHTTPKYIWDDWGEEDSWDD